jgi:hypothetical protein
VERPVVLALRVPEAQLPTTDATDKPPARNPSACVSRDNPVASLREL